MKIGRDSHIMMCCTITIPWKISIGERTYVNEYSYIGGRGGAIGNNCTIALQSIIITASHDTDSDF
jgi:acetyltransferase-like isoleucine patch superfamily enzyme